MLLRAFISYSHADGDLVQREILPQLRNLNVDVWTDADVPPGAYWASEVQAQIRGGDLLVVVLGEEYQRCLRSKAGACYHEALWIHKHVTESRHPPHLVLLLAAGSVPDLFGTHQAIDLSKEGALAKGLSLICGIDRSPLHMLGAQRASILPAPILEHPDQLPELARHNFDATAPLYDAAIKSGNALQAQNIVVLLKLLGALLRTRAFPVPKSWLDVGCGTGLVAAVAQHRANEHGCAWLTVSQSNFGFDYAPGMLHLVRNAGLYARAFESDIRTITPAELAQHTGASQVDLIVANNVFHWLFREKYVSDAFARSYGLLSNGGILAASIAAKGTGRLFLAAYAAEMEEAFDDRSKVERWRDHLKNPIGLQHLDKIVKIAQAQRFTIELAHAVYEPRRYATTHEYVADARAYGERIFMAPFLQRSATEREETWRRIGRRFAELYSVSTPAPSEYIHDQYMIYLIARRLD